MSDAIEFTISVTDESGQPMAGAKAYVVPSSDEDTLEGVRANFEVAHEGTWDEVLESLQFDWSGPLPETDDRGVVELVIPEEYFAAGMNLVVAAEGHVGVVDPIDPAERARVVQLSPFPG